MFNIKVFLFALLFYIATINASDDELHPETTSAIDDLIVSTLTNIFDCLRTFLREGNSTIGIPSFDPLEINGAIRIPLNYDIISGVVTVNDVTLAGLPDFNASVSSSVSILAGGNVAIDVSFESIKLHSGYSLDAKFLVANVYGEGDLSIELSNLAASIGMRVTVLGSPLLRDPSFIFSLGGLDIKITGFRNDDKMSDIISRQLHDTVTHLIEEQQEVISYYVEEIITDLVQNITLSSIGGGGGSGILNC